MYLLRRVPADLGFRTMCKVCICIVDLSDDSRYHPFITAKVSVQSPNIKYFCLVKVCDIKRLKQLSENDSMIHDLPLYIICIFTN